MKPTRTVGGIRITPISDGSFPASISALRNVDPDRVKSMLESRGLPQLPPVSVNTFLVETAGKRILIDTGAGSAMGPTAGKLLANLEAAGVSPADIDTVLLTHIHPDHSNGLVTAQNEPAFPNAEIVVHEDEFAHWTNPANNSGSGIDRLCFENAERAIKPNLDRFRLFTGGEVAPGIEAIPLPGHTPGHTGYRIGDLLIWGDIMHMPDVQAIWPDVGVPFDHDLKQAAETRRKLLAECTASGITIVGMHTEFPLFFKVKPSNGGFLLVPDPASDAETPS